MLVKDLALLLDLFGNSEETKLLICIVIFVWCLQRHRNGGLNSGQKSAIIVRDPLVNYRVKVQDTIDVCACLSIKHFTEAAERDDLSTQASSLQLVKSEIDSEVTSKSEAAPDDNNSADTKEVIVGSPRILELGISK